VITKPFVDHLKITGHRLSQTINAFRQDFEFFRVFLTDRPVAETDATDQTHVDDYVKYVRSTEKVLLGSEALAEPLVGRRLTAVSYYLECLRTTARQNSGIPTESCAGNNLNKHGRGASCL
jgi:hypothetical protein